MRIAYSYFLSNELLVFLRLSSEQQAIISAILHSNCNDLDRVLDVEGIMSKAAIEKQLGCTLGSEMENLSTVTSVALEPGPSAQVSRMPNETNKKSDSAASTELTERYGDTEEEAIESQFASLTVSEQPLAPAWAASTTCMPTSTPSRAELNAASPSENTSTARSESLQQHAPKSTLNPFAKPTVTDIESSTSGLSTRIAFVAKNAQRARFSAFDIVSSATDQPEFLENIIDPSNTVPTPAAHRSVVDPQTRKTNARTSRASGFNVRNDAQRVQDFSIGFQGELFVFELLRSHLPTFTYGNWTSGLREYARAHPDYANISDYTAREKSDITFDDTGGRLTQLFLDEGISEVEPWLAAPSR